MDPPQLPNCRKLDDVGLYGYPRTKTCRNFIEIDDSELYKQAQALNVCYKSLPLYITRGNEKNIGKIFLSRKRTFTSFVNKKKLEKFLIR